MMYISLVGLSTESSKRIVVVASQLFRISDKETYDSAAIAKMGWDTMWNNWIITQGTTLRIFSADKSGLFFVN